jgi:hypothetical protein
MIKPVLKSDSNNQQENLEKVFALECLRRRLNGEKFSIQIPEDIDWEKLYHFLTLNRLASHFSTFSVFSSPQVPLEFRRMLHESRYGLLLYGDACIKQVRVVLQSFQEAGIPVIVLKGWEYIYTIYGGDYGQRFYEDIDLLVLKKDCERAREILRQLNYIPAAESWPGYTLRFKGVQAFFPLKETQPGRSFVIGLHWGLIHSPAYDPERINSEDLFSRAVPIDVAHVEVLQLCVEDQIVYACAHLGYHHDYDKMLYRYYEIAALILKNRNFIVWKTVQRRAKEWKCILPLQQVLAQIDSEWPGIIFQNTMNEIEGLKSTWQERWLHQWMQFARGKSKSFFTGFSGYFSKQRIYAVAIWFGYSRLVMAGFLYQTIFPFLAFISQEVDYFFI